MDKTFLEKIFDNSKDKKIFIIGDIMLDRYLLGDVTRISPEAPVQVFEIRKSEYRLGGAANVGYNVKTLGAEPVLIGIVGDDSEGKILLDEMDKLSLETKGIIFEKGRPTTCKTRVISDSHHLLRIDSESKDEISKESKQKILNYLESNIKDIGVIILQDYNKGVLTNELIHSIIDFAKKNSIKVLVDPKFDNFFEFKDVFLFKPNRKELEDAFGKKAKNIEEFDDFADQLINRINCENIILTLGENGMMIFENKKVSNSSKFSKFNIETKAMSVADVSGAGDTVISTIAVCLAGGANVKDATVIANYAAGIVIKEVGIVPIYKDVLIDYISKEK